MRLHACVWDGVLKGCPVWTGFSTFKYNTNQHGAKLTVLAKSLHLLPSQVKAGFSGDRNIEYGLKTFSHLYFVRNTTQNTSWGRVAVSNSNLPMKQVSATFNIPSRKHVPRRIWLMKYYFFCRCSCNTVSRPFREVWDKACRWKRERIVK